MNIFQRAFFIEIMSPYIREVLTVTLINATTLCYLDVNA